MQLKNTASQPALVTCTVNERHKVTFEIDTGASCNILPLADYIKTTRDRRHIYQLNQGPVDNAQQYQSHTSWQNHGARW